MCSLLCTLHSSIHMQTHKPPRMPFCAHCPCKTPWIVLHIALLAFLRPLFAVVYLLVWALLACEFEQRQWSVVTIDTHTPALETDDEESVRLLVSSTTTTTTTTKPRSVRCRVGCCGQWRCSHLVCHGVYMHGTSLALLAILQTEYELSACSFCFPYSDAWLVVYYVDLGLLVPVTLVIAACLFLSLPGGPSWSSSPSPLPRSLQQKPQQETERDPPVSETAVPIKTVSTVANAPVTLVTPATPPLEPAPMNTGRPTRHLPVQYKMRSSS